MTGEYPVPVMLLSKEENATEVSLAENVGRLNMHAADEVEAVRILHEVDGMTPEQIGDRFGKSHQTIRRRLKLAKVSAKIMDAFRAGEATLDQLEALAVSDDHTAQEKTFLDLPDWSRNPGQIRAALTCEKIRGDHRFVGFIGLSAYEAAGGTITRDLFAGDGECYLDDKPLVMQLVAEKLGEAAKTVEAEGWKWVEYYASDKDSGGSLPVIPSFQREHTEAESAEVADIMAYIEANEAAYDNGELSEAEVATYEGKSERMDEIDALCIGYDPADVAMAGARLILDHAGEINVRRGLLKKEDQHERAAQERRAAAEAREADALTRGEVYTPEPPPVIENEEGASLSAAVVEDLTKTRTAALAVELARRPDVALAVLVHALALPLMYVNAGYGLTPAVAIRPTPAPLNILAGDADNTAPFEAFEKLGAHWSATLPDAAPKLWTWCMEAKPDQLQKLMAYLVAATTNAVQFRQESAGYAGNRLAHADLLAQAVDLDMANWWKPSADFFKRVPKAFAAQALTETGGSPTVAAAMLKGSKADAIDTVLTGLGDRRWLPAPLRTRTAPEPVSEGADGACDAPDVFGDDEGEFAAAAE